jgi:DNA polymerase III delta prime subunit
VIDALVPCVEMFQAGLAPRNRPVGVFLLLGPTGTGKTRTVEALAEALHGSAKSLLKIDCGEYQMEHEVAKLIGAPPGYLGHRETQQRLTSVASEKCGLSLVLFDQIEKAAPSMARLMQGLLTAEFCGWGQHAGQFRKDDCLYDEQSGCAGNDAEDGAGDRISVGRAGRGGGETEESGDERGAAEIFAGVCESHRSCDYVSAARYREFFRDCGS